MANFMTRRFTLREKILMVILIVILLIGLYFFLVHYPIQNRLAEIQRERDEVEEKIQLAEITKSVYDDMKAELEEIFELPEDQITYMPKYDNLQELIIRFDAIFEGTEPQINYGRDPQPKDGIVSRVITFSFRAPNYETAKKIFKDLTGTGFRCLLNSVNVSPSGGDVESGELSVSGTITFYELA